MIWSQKIIVDAFADEINSFCNCLTLIYFIRDISLIEEKKLVILLQMGTTPILSIKLEGLLNGHSDFIRHIISFVRVHIKKWRNHCLRCYHSVDRCRRFPLSDVCLSITFYSKFLILKKFRQG